MKTTIATALSLVGVLAAGSAAALVNTTIFDATPSEATASAAVLPEGATVDLTIPTPVTLAMAATTSTGQQAAGQQAVDAPAVAAPTTSRPSAPVSVKGAAAVAEVDPTSTTTSTTAASPTTTVPASPSTTVPRTAPTTTAPAPVPTTSTPVSRLTTYNLGEVGSVTLDVVNGRLLIVDTRPATGWRVTDAEIDVLTGEADVVFASTDTEVEFTAVLAGGTIVTDIESRLIDTGGYDDDHDDDHDDDDDDDHDDDDDDDDDDHDHDDDDDHDRDDD